MRHYISLLGVLVATAVFTASSQAADLNSDIQRVTQQEQAISAQLAAQLDADQARLARDEAGIESQVARRGYYRHHDHHHHYHRGHYHHGWDRGYYYRGYRVVPYRTYYRPYYGYGSGFYYGRPGFSIGFGF